MTFTAGIIVWAVAAAIIVLEYCWRTGKLPQQLRSKGKDEGKDEGAIEPRTKLLRLVALDAFLVVSYTAVVRVYPSAIGMADVGLLGGLFLHWMVWALLPGDPRAGQKPQETGGSEKGEGKATNGRDAGGGDKSGGSDDRNGGLGAPPRPWPKSPKVRAALLAGTAIIYGSTMEPYISSGTIRYVHSHLGATSALQGNEIQCGPRLQVVLPFVDRVYDYPLGFQRLEFSEGGAVAPIRTETRNGHEIELDVVVVYEMFPEFDWDPSGQPGSLSTHTGAPASTGCAQAVKRGHLRAS